MRMRNRAAASFFEDIHAFFLRTSIILSALGLLKSRTVVFKIIIDSVTLSFCRVPLCSLSGSHPLFLKRVRRHGNYGKEYP